MYVIKWDLGNSDFQTWDKVYLGFHHSISNISDLGVL